MAQRDIIVIGASLGGVDTLPKLVAKLPPKLPAAILVVLHTSPDAPSFLADRLNRVGPLPAREAVNYEPLQPRRIYVATPNHHLMIEGDRIRLTRGPKESHARPSVDVLFRSAAYSAGPRVIGIVLTGLLDDGTAGLWAIKDRGGIAIVQSPQEAAYPSMPQSALRHVSVDYTLEIGDIPNVLGSLTRERIEVEEPDMVDKKLEIETRISLEESALDGVRAIGKPSFYTCPDCHGSMVAIEDGRIRRFRCHTGHAYSELALAECTLPKIEETLWSAMAQAEERETLLRELVQAVGRETDTAEDYARQAQQMRRLIERMRAVVRDQVFDRSVVESVPTSE